jgi:predicted nucleic acid-binding protein
MSGNSIVLDTNIILYLLAGDKTVATFLEDKEGFVSIITELELVGYPDITSKELTKIKEFLSGCNIININEDIKEIYIRLRKQYRIKLGDATAAATAIHLGLPFISADRGFDKIKELQLTSYNP